MASAAHCLYCFDVLSSTLEDKDTSISLKRIQQTWPAYISSFEADKSSSSPLQIPAIQRLGGLNEASSSSTPSSSSSTSLATSTTATTPERSSPGLKSHSEPITASPLFVTWNTVSTGSSHRSLRGCIGTFESQKLSTGLEQYTVISALQDTRFSPITAAELPSLEVSVTLLTDFEEADDQMDWDLGVHGLKINFTAKNRRYNSCYLPDVPVEQGWTKEETIVSLMRKAGWTGKRDKWREVSDFKATRFQGKAESLGWEEYVRWKKWVEKIDEEK